MGAGERFEKMTENVQAPSGTPLLKGRSPYKWLIFVPIFRNFFAKIPMR